MSAQTQSENVIPFSITFSTDRDHFFRRSCPSCGRDFKTQINEADLVTSLQPAFRRMGLVIGAKDSEENQEIKEHLYCPYCEHYDESSHFLTDTFVSYMKRYVMRECMLPMIHQTFSGLADTFGSTGRGRSKGLITLKMSFEVLPPRPISGPEPPDMTIVEFLCCGKRVKIMDNWSSLNKCPYCGTEVLLQ